jgi:outer membrane cobalamin receptor
LKKGFFYIVVMLMPPCIQGQMSFNNDTILIKEVIINGIKSGHHETGSKVISIDSTVIDRYYARSLADLISENSSVFIKTYNQGGIAVPSLRGTSASQTQVAWNDISLNNPMLGQFDLSLVPAGFIDDVNVFYGGASMSLNNGGMGGIINLETKPEWSGKNSLLISPAVGSYGRYSGLLKAKVRTNRFQSVTRAFIRDARNNFSYINDVLTSVPFRERRKDSQVYQRGLIQELYLKGPRSIASAKFWYQSEFRNIPVPMTTQPLNPCENQRDESFRTMLNYNTERGRTDLDVVAAYISDKLNYSNAVASVDSRNESGRMILKSDLKRSIGEKSSIRIGLTGEMNFVRTNNYSGSKGRNTAAVYISGETHLTPLLVTEIILRETTYDKRFLTPDFSGGAEYRILPAGDFKIKAKISKNSRIPSMNEMYWMPGGNPDLKSETGYIAEITGEWSGNLGSCLRLAGDLTYFRNHIYNMIQWQPGEYTYWVARNISELKTSGIESNAKIEFTSGKFVAGLNAGYTLTKAINKHDGTDGNGKAEQQVIYVPVNQLVGSLKLRWFNLHSSINSDYISRRYLNPDNTQYLPGYSVTDLDIGYNMVSGKVRCDISLRAENIFDANYQSIAYYPMPGRAYLFSVVFQLNK